VAQRPYEMNGLAIVPCQLEAPRMEKPRVVRHRVERPRARFFHPKARQGCGLLTGIT
jgi:hypothetical protein